MMFWVMSNSSTRPFMCVIEFSELPRRFELFDRVALSSKGSTSNIKSMIGNSSRGESIASIPFTFERHEFMVHDPFFIPFTFERHHSFALSMSCIATNVTLRNYEQVPVTFKHCSTSKIKLFNSLASRIPFKRLCSWILSLLSPHELGLRCGSLQPNLSNSLECSSQP